MKSMIAGRASAITPSITLAIAARAKELKKQGMDVVDYGAGEPDFGTPAFISRAGCEAIEQGQTRYTPASGSAELKAAIIKKLREENGLEYSPAEVIVSCGAKHSISNLILTIIEEGDEVLLPAPYWLSYPEMVKLAGGIVQVLPTTAESGFKITPAQLKAACGGRTKLLILNSPSNPTGAIYTPAELGALAEVMIEKDIWCLSDEIYERLVYGGAVHKSIAQVDPRMKERTLVVNGHSKAFAMTGWRIGYAAGPADVIKAASSIQSHTTSNPASMSQAAATVALTNKTEADVEIERMCVEFDKRRRRMVDGLRAIPGVKLPVEPEGAFYVFPDVSGLYGKGAFAKCSNSVEFSKVCLEEGHVALVPGGDFGEDRCVRLSYATSMERVETGLKRLAELATKS